MQHITNPEVRVVELEGDLKLANIMYQTICDKLGRANGRISRLHIKKSILWTENRRLKERIKELEEALNDKS